MKVFFDTTVLIAAVLEDHSDHPRAFAALARVQSGQDEGVVSAHSLAETYAILTKLPGPFRHSAGQALLSIEENILAHFVTTSLSGSDYRHLLREAAATGIQGGTIYDAVLMRCAQKAAVARILTLNLRHFQAVAPQHLAGIVAVP